MPQGEETMNSGVFFGHRQHLLGGIELTKLALFSVKSILLPTIYVPPEPRELRILRRVSVDK